MAYAKKSQVLSAKGSSYFSRRKNPAPARRIISTRRSSEFNLKPPRTPVSAYAPAVSPRNVVLFAIVCVTVLLAVTIICAAIFTPERQTKQHLDALASDYYENIFYSDMISSEDYTGNPETALQKLAASGLAPVTLRQLILLNPNADPATVKYLEQNCDTEATSVIFYPDAPYSRTSYHTNIAYSCNFQ